MSRLLAFLAAGVGAATVSTGGVFLLKNQDSKKEDGKDQKQNQKANDKIDSNLDFTDLITFANKKGGGCATKHFGDQVNYSSKGEEINNSDKKIEDSYFSGESENAESCLVVNGEKKKETVAEPKKGSGNFKWLWTFKKGTKGFVMFVTTKPTNTEKQMDLEGGIYFIEQSDSTGSVKKHKDLKSKNISDSNFDNSLPKVGSSIKSTLSEVSVEKEKDYWGFVSGKDDLEHLCAQGKNDCPKDPSESSPLKGVWIGTFSAGNDQGLIKDGSANFDAGSDDLFADVKLKSVLSTFKGTGTKQENPTS